MNVTLITGEIPDIVVSFARISLHGLLVFLPSIVLFMLLAGVKLEVADFTLKNFDFLLYLLFRFFWQDFNRWRPLSLLFFGPTFLPVMLDMAPPVSFSPLHVNLADPAHGRAPTFTVDEEEMTVSLTDVLENQLLPGFHIEVRAELTSPVEKIGGQEDEGGERGLLGHTVDLLQVGLDLLVGQEVPGHTGELKYQDILRTITFLNIEGPTYLADCTAECIAFVEEFDVVSQLQPRNQAWPRTVRTLHQLQASKPRHPPVLCLNFYFKYWLSLGDFSLEM